VSRTDPIVRTVLAMLVLAVATVVGLLMLTVVGAPVWIDSVVLMAALVIAAAIGEYGFISTPDRGRHEDRESE